MTVYDCDVKREVSTDPASGRIRRGYRVRYRLDPHGPWRSFFLTTVGDLAPTTPEAMTAIEEHAAGPSRGW